MIKGKFEFKELKQYQKKIENLAKNGEQITLFCTTCSKILAARLLALVIEATPVGESLEYIDDDGKTKVMKTGGTLRRGWIAKTEQEAENVNIPTVQDAINYAQTLPIIKNGNIYTIEIINPVHYASYVENGHRQEVGRYVPAIGKKLTVSWVEGKFMLRNSEKAVENIMPQLLEKELNKFLEEYFNGN